MENIEIECTKEYKEGCDAARKDYKPRTQNPYPIGTIEANRWSHGYVKTDFETHYWEQINNDKTHNI